MWPQAEGQRGWSQAPEALGGSPQSQEEAARPPWHGPPASRAGRQQESSAPCLWTFVAAQEANAQQGKDERVACWGHTREEPAGGWDHSSIQRQLHVA